MRYLLIFALVSVAACGAGGKDSNPTSPSASTPSPYNQTVAGTVSSFGLTQHPVSIPRSGQMTLSLTWGTAADLDLYLTSSTCNGYPPTDCQILAASDGLASTERITRTVASGETYKAWVDNFATSPQNYSITITIQ